MSTEIKPGQIWAKDDDHAYEVKVVWASNDSVHYERPTVGESRAQAKAFLYEFHLVKDVDATPAPLDPSADDALAASLQRLGKVWGEYRDQQVRGAAKALDVVAASIQQVVDAANAAHQPAPELEPEWKPGTTGTATVAHLAGGTAVLDMRVMRVEWDGLLGFATQTGRIVEDGSTEWSVYDLVPDEPRPLPTRDDLARVMHDDYLPNGEPRLGRTHREILADAVLAHLRGESR